MKAIFEQKVYELEPFIKQYSHDAYCTQSIDYNGTTIEYRVPITCKHVSYEKRYVRTHRYVVYCDLYRLSLGDKYFLPGLNQTITVVDRTVINDNEIVFLIDKIKCVDCENYKELFINLRKQIEEEQDELSESAKQQAISDIEFKKSKTCHKSGRVKRFIEWFASSDLK